MTKFKLVFLGLITIVSSQLIYADDLTSLVAKAKISSPYLPMALAQQEIALQKLNQAKAGLHPKFNFNAQEKRGITDNSNGKDSEYNLRNYAIQVSIPLYNQPQNQEITTAKINEQIASLQFEINYEELLLNLSDQYFKILDVKSGIELLEQQKILVLAQEKMATAHFNRGVTSITDLKEAEAKLMTIDSQINSLNLELSKNIFLLSEIVGSSDIIVSKTDINIEKLPVLFAQNQDEFNLILVKNNHQIKISELNLDVIKSQIKQTQASKYPNLSFTSKLTRSFSSQDSAYVSKQDGLDYLYGFELNIPLYNSENTYKIKEQYASLEKSKSELAFTIQKQKMQMQEAYFNTLSSIVKVNGLAKAESAAQISWLANKRAYEVGMRVNADVLEAQAKYFEVKQERLKAWYDAWQNYIKVKVVTGNFNESELAKIDQIFYKKR